MGQEMGGDGGDAPSVVIADDNSDDRAAIRGVLERDGWSVLGEPTTAEAAAKLVLTTRPDVALLASRLPGSGLNSANAIVVAAPDVAIVMMANSATGADVLEAIGAGVCGYLLKGAGVAAIPVALRAVLNGETALPRALVDALVEEVRLRHRRRLGREGTTSIRLTDREWDVIELLAEGLSTTEIGKRLFVSPITVRTHIANVARRLGVADREAVIARFRDP